ncbi:MAG: flagellar basal body rod protein FlgB [Rubrivivax sp.]
MMNRLTQNLDFHAQALTLRSERQRLIASNIANADTPGYVARDFDFGRALRDATAGSAAAGLPGATRSPLSGSDLALRYATNPQDSMDRNTVDMDRERASFADNTVKYEATLRFITRSMRTMMDAMKGHNAG